MILLTYNFATFIPNSPGFIISILQFLPYLLIFSIIAFSITNQQSRELIIGLSFLISFWLIKNLIWPTDANVATAATLFVLIGPLLAFNFLYIIRTPEKGLHNNNGLQLTVLFTIEFFIIIWFVNFTPNLLLKYIYYPYFSSTFFNNTAMYQSTIIINAIVFLILLTNAIIKQKVLMTAYLAAFISIVLAQHFLNNQATAIMFFSVACFILLFALGISSFHLSKFDLITELPSTRTFKQQLTRLDSRYCIALIEVDDFKEITEQYGQEICDEILRMIASRSQLLGRKGFPYRYGNKEFSLIFYDMQLQEANKYLATLCDSIANEPFMLRSKRSIFQSNEPDNMIAKPIPVSISVGIAEKQQHHTSAFEVLITAQEALEQVKEQQQYFATLSG